MAAVPETLIVAVATPPGRGAISIVRLSGPGAIEVVAGLAGRSAFRPRVATLASLRLPDGMSDRAVVTTFVAPRSFTGEDCAEVSTHGSPVIVEAVLQACLNAGARLARPGEFTLRAYLNQRLDLLQAEAIADLVAATTATQVRVASSHLDGSLSRAITSMGDDLARLRALLEASLDFPDEGYHFIDPQVLVERLQEAVAVCARLLGSASAGQRLHDGALVVIAGRPNAGKSTLFNALLGRDRAIVTPVPGTTRDLLTEGTSFGGVPVTLVDTAGIRGVDDAVEREGVLRAEATVAAADLVVIAVEIGQDGEGVGHAGSDRESLEGAGGLWTSLEGRARLCVITKTDIGKPDGLVRPAWAPADALLVSASTGHGMAALRGRLGELIGQTTWDDATLTRARHRTLVQECAVALARASETAAAGGSEEYVLADLKDALVALEALRGVESPEDVLQEIFATFCIGK